MILGSHNTMTYLTPDNKLLKLFSFLYKCQDETISEQFNRGCRCFDLRIRLHKGNWVFAHGLFRSSDYQPMDILNILNALAVMNNEKLYIRLLLETKKYNKEQEEGFVEFCKSLKNKYFGNLIFFEGRRKYDWEILYDFGVYPNVVQYVGSMRSWYGKIWPKLYWAINIERDLQEASSQSDDTLCLFDFI